MKTKQKDYQSPQIESVKLDTPLCVEALSTIWDNDPLITEEPVEF